MAQFKRVNILAASVIFTMLLLTLPAAAASDISTATPAPESTAGPTSFLDGGMYVSMDIVMIILAAVAALAIAALIVYFFTGRHKRGKMSGTELEKEYFYGIVMGETQGKDGKEKTPKK